jgi:hypothetical protein
MQVLSQLSYNPTVGPLIGEDIGRHPGRSPGCSASEFRVLRRPAFTIPARFVPERSAYYSRVVAFVLEYSSRGAKPTLRRPLAQALAASGSMVRSPSSSGRGA